MPKVQVYEHTTSYQAITSKSPHGLRCLKTLFLEYDNPDPNRSVLQNLLARDFTDNENESTRSIGRDEAIEHIISTRQKCSRHQIDLKRAMCIEHEGRRQEVFFEGVRHMLLSFPEDREDELPIVEDKGDWIRVPFSGRIEVRVKENRFTLKESIIEVVARRLTEDKSALVKRDLALRRADSTMSALNLGPVSPLSEDQRLSAAALQSSRSLGASQIGLPQGGASELPAMVATLTGDSKGLPPYRSTTPTVASGSSVTGV